MAYADAMESAPHVYLSALSWLPENAQLQSVVANTFKHLPMIKHGEDDWEGARWVKNVGNRVFSVAYSPDGRFFAAGLSDGTVRIFDAHTCEPVGQPLEGHMRQVESVAFSPDSRLIASSSGDGKICIWDLASGDALTTIEADSWCQSVAFSPDGQQLVSGFMDNTIRVWDVKTGKRIIGTGLPPPEIPRAGTKLGDRNSRFFAGWRFEDRWMKGPSGEGRVLLPSNWRHLVKQVDRGLYVHKWLNLKNCNAVAKNNKGFLLTDS